MQTQSSHIEDRLADHGWRIVTKQDTVEWWADEMWTLESIWSPAGTQAFITFLVDPESYTSNRKKGTHVWAAKASPTRPVNWLAGAHEFTMNLGSGWRNDLPTLFEQMDTFRGKLK